ncbi:uncharacterized protein SCHCODRAFT_02050003, partial [Schizophyllum commune H4-8]|uniref:uncharacterized protein n=1 Tax=Schizophyllum commune (strain H4-8 / FGSC 9210) TaxID=578458 RepID=UPI00215F1C18
LTPTPLHVTPSAAIFSKPSSRTGRDGTYVSGSVALSLSSLAPQYVPWLPMVGLTAAWVYAQIPCVVNTQCLLRQSMERQATTSSRGRAARRQDIGSGRLGPSSEWAPRLAMA